MSTFTLPEVFDHPPLISSLSAYSYDRLAVLERHAETEDPTRRQSRIPMEKSRLEPEPESVLFLQIFTAADYFTVDKALMDNPLPVEVDIILDPYIFNIFPKSLVPTAVYILIIAVGAWFVSLLVWSGLSNVAQSSRQVNREKGSYKEKKNT